MSIGGLGSAYDAGRRAARRGGPQPPRVTSVPPNRASLAWQGWKDEAARMASRGELPQTELELVARPHRAK